MTCWRETGLSDSQEDRIIDLLAEGFGVEDIARALGLTLRQVSSFVFGMTPDLRAEIYRQPE